MVINGNQLPGIRDSETAFFALGRMGRGHFFGRGRGQNHRGGAGKRSNPPGAGHFQGDAKILSTSPCYGSYQILLVSPNSASMLLIFCNLIWAKWFALKAAKHFHLLEYFKNTRPKPAYGRQGLDWDSRARIQFSQVQTWRYQQRDPTDLLWCKNVTVTHRGVQLTSFDAKTWSLLTGGSNWPPLMQKCDRYLQGGPTDLLWCKNVTVTHRGVQLTF